MVYPENGVLISAKKNELPSHENTQNTSMPITKAVIQKRLHIVYFQLYDIMERQNWRQ